VLLGEVRAGELVLPNRDLDDGKITSAAEYTLADEAYAKLLYKLSYAKLDGTTPQLRNNMKIGLTFDGLPVPLSFTDTSGPLPHVVPIAQTRSVLSTPCS